MVVAGQGEAAENQIGQCGKYGHAHAVRHPELGVFGNALLHRQPVSHNAVDGQRRQAAYHDTTHGHQGHHQHGNTVFNGHVEGYRHYYSHHQPAGPNAGDHSAA